jgi:phenylacetaldehyde dehydrogenase
MDQLRRHIATLKVGAGLAPDTFMGPLVNAAQRDRVLGYITAARDATDVFQGRAPQNGPGFFVPPTIVAGAEHGAAITQEEIFGPVMSVYRFRDIDEVLAAANGTVYGLAAYVWSRDINRALTMAAALECGKVMINTPGFPYPPLPEGGYKSSGYGKDLGREAIEQCLQTKAVLVRTG